MRIKIVLLLAHGWLLTKDNLLSSLRIHGKHAPVDVASIAQVRIVTFISCHLENFSNKVLSFIFKLQVKLDGGSQDCHLHTLCLVFEAFAEVRDELH